MRKVILYVTVSSIVAGAMMRCGHHQSAGNLSIAMANDSAALFQAFQSLKSDTTFLKDLGLEEGSQFSWNDQEIKVIFGDLDNDRTIDALLGFSIEGRGGGNTYDYHYAALLKKDNLWTYSGLLNASILFEDRYYAAEKIENGLIKGAWLGNMDESLTPRAADYVVRKGQLVNTFTALHKTENVEREYLYVAEILTPESISIRRSATVEEYEKLLGKGKIAQPEEQPECGTYFDEGRARYLAYPNLRFEINDENQAGLIEVELKNGIKLQTDKGTITENTKVDELKNIFYQSDSWNIFDAEYGSRIFAISDDAGSDNQWHFTFNKIGKLISVSLFIPC